MIPTLLLAAGASSRMGGRDKLLEQVAGVPLLTLQCQRALAAGPTAVTLPPKPHPRYDVLSRGVVAVATSGQMSDSLRAGLAALPPDATGVIILPADMPDITTQDLQNIQSAATEDTAIVRATTADSRPGHPIYFAKNTFPDFDHLTGDRGAFRICEKFKNQTIFVPLQGDRARLDLDTPEDWAAYRARLTT